MSALEGSMGVVGGASVAAGIVQVLAEAGFRVRLFDPEPGRAEGARGFACRMLDRKSEKGQITAAAARDAQQAIEVGARLADLAGCSVVIESTLGGPETVRELIAAFEGVLDGEAVIATNTSATPVTVLAAHAGAPQRVAGLHFFDPVPLIRIVEVIPGLRTAPAVIDVVDELVRRIGHRPIHVDDSPGFLVNHLGRGLLTEGARIVAERIADPAVVDRVLVDVLGLRVGPFELLDLTGLDVSLPVMEQIYAQFYDEPRFRPAAFLALRCAAGFTGRKSGAGFYRYAEGRRVPDPEPPHPESPGVTVWIDQADPAAAARIRTHLGPSSVAFDDGSRPGDASLCLVMPVGADATTTALDHGLDPRRTVAVDALFGPAPRATLMAAPTIDPGMRKAALALFGRAGRASWIADSPGFLAQRTVAMIVNIACEMAQQGIAKPGDVDTVVVAALGYPKGPFVWGDGLGASTILSILEAMFAFYGDPRYRPSPWLKRRARLGVSLCTAEREI
jgi:3-hydroxybutyryl-CoA dehydrogenase